MTSWLGRSGLALAPTIAMVLTERSTLAIKADTCRVTLPEETPPESAAYLEVVEFKPGASATADELIAWCRSQLAAYKCPRHIVFMEIPKTSTGKIQKFKLRGAAKEV